MIKRIVLVGAGHAHLYLAKRARLFRERGVELILVDPGDFEYSGLATGVLGGDYDWTLDRIDAGRLIESNGGRFVRDCVAALEPTARQARLESGHTLEYDAISFNTGSKINETLIPGAECAWMVKPIANLWRLRAHLEKSLSERSALRAVVIGGGATGVEVAANMDALAQRCGGRLDITLVSSAPRVLTHASRRAAKLAERHLRSRGIVLTLERHIERIREDAAYTREGERYEFDVLVLATGLVANPLMGRLGLSADEEKGLCVDASLRSLSADNVFGAGDCIVFDNRKLPMLGVHGVRQAPILMHNLLARLCGGGLKRYRPRPWYLSILNLGCREALALWGPFHWLGRSSFVWKDHIDRKFLAQYGIGKQ